VTHTLQPALNKAYPAAVRAEGLYIFDKSGKAWLDGSSGPVACSLGHSHPRVVEVIREQAGRLQYAHRSMFATEESERLATRLCDISPGKKYTRSYFVSSGSEATETAMKIAIQYWQELGKPSKDKFITRWKSYHGMTTGALSLSGFRSRRRAFEPSLAKFPRLSSDLENDPVEVQAAEFEKAIYELGADTIAGFVAEPVVGAAGTALVPPAGYYERFREICDHHNLLFIADEVMTGIGRTGTWFGLEHWNTTADIVALGKSLGSGYAPIAATLITEKVLDPIRKGAGTILSGHTYSAHPLSCAVGLSVVETIQNEKLLQAVGRIGANLRSELEALKQRHPVIQTVRGKGLLLGVEFDPHVAGLQSRFLQACFENGLLLYPSSGGPQGTDENGALVAPPYIITDAQIGELMDKMERSLSEVLNKSTR
jgi:adenosylmethionine-8-amino-7-oxononanoate aminotransferase